LEIARERWGANNQNFKGTGISRETGGRSGSRIILKRGCTTKAGGTDSYLR